MTSIPADSSTPSSSGSDVTDKLPEVSPLIEKLARFGYAAKGVTYLLVGVFATQAAFLAGGSTDGSKGTLRSLAEGTFGTTLVAAIGVGLIGYSLWMLTRLFVDPEDEGDDKSGIAKRIFFGISGLIHASLAFVALTAAFTDSGGGGGSGGGAQSKVAMALAWPGGQFAVGAVALGIIGYGFYQFYKAFTVDLSSQLAMGQMSDKMKKAATFSHVAGHTGRGIAFSLIGVFILTAAWQHDSSEAGGLGAALSTLGGFGNIALGVTAIGLAAYGIHMMIKAGYRRINVG